MAFLGGVIAIICGIMALVAKIDNDQKHAATVFFVIFLIGLMMIVGDIRYSNTHNEWYLDRVEITNTIDGQEFPTIFYVEFYNYDDGVSFTMVGEDTRREIYTLRQAEEMGKTFVMPGVDY